MRLVVLINCIILPVFIGSLLVGENLKVDFLQKIIFLSIMAVGLVDVIVLSISSFVRNWCCKEGFYLNFFRSYDTAASWVNLMKNSIYLIEIEIKLYYLKKEREKLNEDDEMNGK